LKAGPVSRLSQLRLERFSFNLGVFLLIAIMLVILVVVVPAAEFDLPDVRGNFGETQRATVLRVLDESTSETPRGREHYQKLEVDVGGRAIVIEQTAVEGSAQRFVFGAGDKVLVTATSTPGGESYYIADYARESQLWILAGAFAVLVVAIGRWQGVTSLVGMAASLLVILRFIVPGIISGHDPVTISVIGAIAILISSLYLAHGINRKTTTALLGTAASLAITAALASFSVDFAELSGLADEQAVTLNIITNGGINAQGLLLAGMIIGALGVLDDVTVAQASAVFELQAANPALKVRDLFGRAMNIGRDHIASTVNTLFLAYAGAALPLLIILALQTEPVGTLVNREFLATEVIRTLVGSIGIVASVPLTTALAAASTRLDGGAALIAEPEQEHA
jgi:uncharacterized membrane protein